MRALPHAGGPVLALALLAHGVAAPRGDVGLEPGRETQIAFDLLATEPGGATRIAGGLRSAPLVPGSGSGPSYLSASVAVDAAGCGGVTVAVGLAPPPPIPAPAAAWEVEALLVGLAPDRDTLEVRWRRLDPSSAAPAPGEATTERLSVEPGQRVLLDFVPAPTASRRCLRNLALELSTRRPHPPGYEGRTVSYEIWMVHEMEGRLVRSRVFRSTVGDGDAAGFRFPAEPLDGSADVALRGDVRGWPRLDGRVDVVVTAWRTVTLRDGGASFSGMGRKAATLAAGEAVRLTLPEPLADAARALPALAGHTFALVLVARPEP